MLDIDGQEAVSELTALVQHTAEGEYAVAWQPQRLASMTLTSGSTGLPKAAVHTCAAHLASAEGVLSLIPFAPRR